MVLLVKACAMFVLLLAGSASTEWGITGRQAEGLHPMKRFRVELQVVSSSYPFTC